MGIRFWNQSLTIRRSEKNTCTDLDVELLEVEAAIVTFIDLVLQSFGECEPDSPGTGSMM